MSSDGEEFKTPNAMTVKKLREALKKVGLKTTGNKEELTTRLKLHFDGIDKDNDEGDRKNDSDKNTDSESVVKVKENEKKKKY